MSDDTLTGYLWAENVGWIHLNPAQGGVINDRYGTLSGYAWGENIGWIDFAPSMEGSPSTLPPGPFPATPGVRI